MTRVRDDVLSIVRREKQMTEETQPVSPEASGPAASSTAASSRIDPWLREILRCPQCRSTLSDGSGPSGPELHCTNTECRLAYRVDNGIPVLLVDESRSLAG
jgi:uncharacterized protein YbaR (Trm112 family)